MTVSGWLRIIEFQTDEDFRAIAGRIEPLFQWESRFQNAYNGCKFTRPFLERLLSNQEPAVTWGYTEGFHNVDKVLEDHLRDAGCDVRFQILQGSEVVPVTMGQSLRWQALPKSNVVRKSLHGNVEVSTVFTQSMMLPSSQSLPDFETMVFGGTRNLGKLTADTYPEALACHCAMIKLLSCDAECN